MLLSAPEISFAHVAPLASNVRAIEVGLQFVTGDGPFGVILGPSGWGKSLILRASASVCHRTRGEGTVYSGGEIATHRRVMEGAELLILDDAQDALSRNRTRAEITRLIESRHRHNRPTLVAATVDDRRVDLLSRVAPTFLSNSRGWNVATIQPPTLAERGKLVAHLANAEELRLSESLVVIISHNVRGDARSIVGALRRLRVEGSDWRGARGTLRALGALDAYFKDNPEWDLRQQIARQSELDRTRFAAFSPLELACYTMLVEASLCERSVAQYFGFEPSVAYLHATRLKRVLDHHEESRAAIATFIDRIVASLVPEGVVTGTDRHRSSPSMTPGNGAG